MSPQRGAFVYFASPIDGGPIKIGFSQSPQDRLTSLMALAAYPLTLLATAPGRANDERKLHSTFIKDHLRSEWFRPSVEIWALIGVLRETGELPEHLRGSATQRDELRRKSNAEGVRGTPEWRAEMSRIHKARYARERATRDMEKRIAQFLADNAIGASAINTAPAFSKRRSSPVGCRADGSIVLYSDDDAAAIESFMASYLSKLTERASP